nr:dienelactone hydrolase family protein [Alloactinosynnema sp. L-07]
MRIVAVAGAVVAAGVIGLEASAAGNPYQRGPDPTVAVLEAARGPFAVNQTAARPSGGFGGGTITYPTDMSQGRFGAIAVAPGFTEGESAIAWFGPRVASHGFVVITIKTNGIFDSPDARGAQLLAALDYLTKSSPVRDRIDATRLGVMGHSMGGGGALHAAAQRPSLRAAVPLTGWSRNKNWSSVRVPTMVIGAENDGVAPPSAHSEPFYQSLGGEKAYLEMNDANHFVTNSATPTVGKFTVSWLKRFIDDDTRYEPFLCPPPQPSRVISEYRDTCPHV